MKINGQRRLFLKTSLSATQLGLAVAAGLLIPSSICASWPVKAFDSKTVSDAVVNLFGNTQIKSTDKILINAPEFAENGAMVPISIETNLSKIDSLSLLVSKNDTPLASSYEFYDDMEGFISTRLKFKESADIIVIAKINGEILSTSKAIKVSIGGCGPRLKNKTTPLL